MPSLNLFSTSLSREERASSHTAASNPMPLLTTKKRSSGVAPPPFFTEVSAWLFMESFPKSILRDISLFRIAFRIFSGSFPSRISLARSLPEPVGIKPIFALEKSRIPCKASFTVPSPPRMIRLTVLSSDVTSAASSAICPLWVESMSRYGIFRSWKTGSSCFQICIPLPELEEGFIII